LVVTAANATRRRGHPYTSAARKHWKQCVSEGGTKNCAKCRGTDSGSLDCAAPSCDNEKYPLDNECSKDCPEYFTSQNNYGPRFFAVTPSGKGTCKAFLMNSNNDSPLSFHGLNVKWGTGQKKGNLIPGADKLLPGCNGTFDGPHMIHKATMEHPKYGDLSWVALVHKRLVMHPHTTTNVMVADVFKVGLCVKCQTNVVKTAGDNFANAVLKNRVGVKKEDLYKDDGCLKKAFDNNTGELKPEYRCDNSTESYGHYQSFLAAF